MDALYCVISFAGGAALAGAFLLVRQRVENRAWDGRVQFLEKELADLKAQLVRKQEEIVRATADLAKARADLHHAELLGQNQRSELEQVEGRFRTEFENLANKILEEKSTRFAAQNQANLNQVLGPLRQQIGEFRTKVEEIHRNDVADRAVLKTQLESLAKTNNSMSEEAKNLTLALKGDSKAQGAWGELVLERVLESSGLRRGQEFTVQETLKSADGSWLRPDVIIHLPERRHLVVDSKVSLTAYERYCSSREPEAGRLALQEHVRSIRKHVAELAAKGYQDLHHISTPEFVFMFVPVEPALTCALQADRSLFNEAFEKRIILVTPSTLLATLRTVAQIWKQEKQTRNALEIARRSGALYDKFVGFYSDLQVLGEKLNDTNAAYAAALNKLKTGRGNLVKSAEDLRNLGARATKELPADTVRGAEESESA
jgi:DNA recombination protein RmuC